jgi:hypothetical protein
MKLRDLLNEVLCNCDRFLMLGILWCSSLLPVSAAPCEGGLGRKNLITNKFWKTLRAYSLNDLMLISGNGLLWEAFNTVDHRPLLFQC